MKKGKIQLNIEEENNMISFDIIREKCIQYNCNTITKDEFIKFLDENLIVEKYVNSDLKKSYIVLFYAMNSEEENDYVDMAYLFEIFSILMFLFAYTNIDIKVDDMNEVIYDIVIKSGLEEYISDKVGKDFNNWIKLFEKTVMFRNAYVLENLNNNIDLDELKKFSKETQSNFSNMDKSQLEYVATIIENNDPSMQKIKNAIYDGITNMPIVEEDTKKE